MAKALLDAGQSQAEASRQTGIPRSTIGVWVKRGPAKAVVSEPCSPCQHIERVAALPVYAYLLGLYLGDGCISRHRRGVHRLRIALDLSYPGIIAECATAMASVLPNRVGQVRCEGYAEVTSYSRHWPCLFPQAGAGPKHKRPIVLDAWQHEGAIVRNPEQLLRGLIHSDGWRGTNVAVKGNGTPILGTFSAIGQKTFAGSLRRPATKLEWPVIAATNGSSPSPANPMWRASTTLSVRSAEFVPGAGFEPASPFGQWGLSP
jgi:hypothetical protein